jgi:hypothetical protein
MTTEREYRHQGETLGSGFDSFEERLLPNIAIDLDDVNEDELIDENFLPKDKFVFQQIADKQVLGEMLNTSISVSGTTPILLGHCPCLLEGEAKAQYFKQSNINEDNICLFLDYQFTGASYRIKKPKLSQEAIELLHDKRRNLDEFRRIYGDEFIVGFKKRAEYTAQKEIEVAEKSKEEQKSFGIISALQSAFVTVIGGGLGFKLEEEAKEYLKSTKTTISCFRNGSPVGDTVFTIEQMIKNFTEFQTTLKKRKEKGGVKYISLFADYDQLIETRNYRILRPELKELKRKLKDIRARKTQRQIEILVCENKLRFGDSNSNSPNLPQQIRKLEDSVSKIQDFIRRCEIEPELISSQEYKEILKYKEIIDTKI